MIRVSESILTIIFACLMGFLLSFSVTQAQAQTSYIIVHAHNPERVEIASIQGMGQNSVEIHDGDTLIGYGAHNAETHNQPIPISTATHTIKAKFNGMTKEQTITLRPNEIKVITFIFSRIDRDYSAIFDYSKVENVEYQTEGEVYPSPGGLYSANVYIGWGPMCWIGVCNLLSTNRSLTYQWIYYNMSGGVRVTWERTGNHVKVSGEFHAEVEFEIDMDIMFSLEVNNFYRSQFYSGVFGKSITPYYGFDYFFVQRYNPSPYYYALDYFNASETTMSIGYPNGEGGAGGQEDLYNQSSRSFVQSKIIHDWYEPWAQAVVSNVPYDITGTGIKDEEKQPPVASFTYSPENPLVDEEITFDASSSYDSDGEIVSYNWDFGDGNTAEGTVVTHAYPEVGVYTVTLTVTDNEGLTVSTSKVIGVEGENQPQPCDFSTEPGIERCFGGIGTQCEGDVLYFYKDENTCLVQGWMSVGSILHDRCCYETNNEGYGCHGPLTGNPDLCANAWAEAKFNTICGRFWPYTFGPYPTGNTGDCPNKQCPDLRAPPGAKVKIDQQGFCLSGKCRVNAKGNTIIKWDKCGRYCECQ